MSNEALEVLSVESLSHLSCMELCDLYVRTSIMLAKQVSAMTARYFADKGWDDPMARRCVYNLLLYRLEIIWVLGYGAVPYIRLLDTTECCVTARIALSLKKMYKNVLTDASLKYDPLHVPPRKVTKQHITFAHRLMSTFEYSEYEIPCTVITTCGCRYPEAFVLPVIMSFDCDFVLLSVFKEDLVALHSLIGSCTKKGGPIPCLLLGETMKECGTKEGALKVIYDALKKASMLYSGMQYGQPHKISSCESPADLKRRPIVILADAMSDVVCDAIQDIRLPYYQVVFFSPPQMSVMFPHIQLQCSCKKLFSFQNRIRFASKKPMTIITNISGVSANIALLDNCGIDMRHTAKELFYKHIEPESDGRLSPFNKLLDSSCSNVAVYDFGIQHMSIASVNKKSYSKGADTKVKRLKKHIDKGERVLVVAPSNMQKETLAKKFKEFFPDLYELTFSQSVFANFLKPKFNGQGQKLLLGIWYQAALIPFSDMADGQIDVVYFMNGMLSNSVISIIASQITFSYGIRQYAHETIKPYKPPKLKVIATLGSIANSFRFGLFTVAKAHDKILGPKQDGVPKFKELPSNIQGMDDEERIKTFCDKLVIASDMFRCESQILTYQSYCSTVNSGIIGVGYGLGCKTWCFQKPPGPHSAVMDARELAVTICKILMAPQEGEDGKCKEQKQLSLTKLDKFLADKFQTKGRETILLQFIARYTVEYLLCAHIIEATLPGGVVLQNRITNSIRLVRGPLIFDFLFNKAPVFIYMPSSISEIVNESSNIPCVMSTGPSLPLYEMSCVTVPSIVWQVGLPARSISLKGYVSSYKRTDTHELVNILGHSRTFIEEENRVAALRAQRTLKPIRAKIPFTDEQIDEWYAPPAPNTEDIFAPRPFVEEQSTKLIAACCAASPCLKAEFL